MRSVILPISWAAGHVFVRRVSMIWATSTSVLSVLLDFVCFWNAWKGARALDFRGRFGSFRGITPPTVARLNSKQEQLKRLKSPNQFELATFSNIQASKAASKACFETKACAPLVQHLEARYMGSGMCRHRCLLFKYIAQRLKAREHGWAREPFAKATSCQYKHADRHTYMHAFNNDTRYAFTYVLAMLGLPTVPTYQWVRTVPYGISCTQLTVVLTCNYCL